VCKAAHFSIAATEAVIAATIVPTSGTVAAQQEALSKTHFPRSCAIHLILVIFFN